MVFSIRKCVWWIIDFVVFMIKETLYRKSINYWAILSLKVTETVDFKPFKYIS